MILLRWTDFRSRFATSATLGPDGVEVWPESKLRSGGFDSGFGGLPRALSAFPFVVSCNSQAADGGAAYDWYLSQRTDDSTLQWLSITQHSATQSGTVDIALTAKCVSDLGLSGATATLTQDQVREILRHCTLYVQRVSDDAIQAFNLLQYTHSNY